MVDKRKRDNDTDSRRASFHLPASEGELWDLVEKAKHQRKTTQNFHPLLSGSKIIEFDIKQYGLDRSWDEAEARLNASAEFKNYLNLVEITNEIEIVCEGHESWPGAFYPTLVFQHKCRKLKGNAPCRPRLQRDGLNAGVSRICLDPKQWRPKPSSPNTIYEAEDENIMNVALVLFLEAIAKIIKAKQVEWLRNSPGEIEKLLNGYRVLISQNANQIFLSFAKANGPYYDYLDTGDISQEPFLSIQKWGPWLVNHEKHMKHLVIILAAIILSLGG
ncbi:hypothetical protein BDV26DRAFT_294552 [Aspergillus bertholletiae]|uniref:Uncharacterized protein n=1 Tax=Aspergillus bertholletiae TaxID=1226010 RepID=A0A5N7B434_9EURO|nr:hypothetical protein BDV26DRAFT_294552 [Aspergillus bertholletiae]